VIEFHELRKKKAEENIQKKEAGTQITRSLHTWKLKGAVRYLSDIT
jgi:hypothetical protein